MSTDYVTEISPNSNVVMIWGCPCTKDYRHSLRFNSVDDQVNYFIYGNSGDKVSVTNKVNTTLKRLKFDKVNYVRVNRNTIKLSVKQNESVWYNAEKLMTCNYMAFQNQSFGDKWFYAFVDTVRYINNNTVEVEYTLDVLQTWWFDLKFGECYVERETPIADAYEEMLVPEDIPTGDEIIYDTKDVGAVWVTSIKTTKAIWAQGSSWKDKIGTDTPISKVGGVYVQSVGDMEGVEYNKVINIAFSVNDNAKNDEFVSALNNYLKKFGGNQTPYLCVCTIPVLTDYVYTSDGDWWSDNPNRIIAGGGVFGYRFDKTVDTGAPLPTPDIATYLWFRTVINNILSIGGTIYSCWEEPIFSFRNRNEGVFNSFSYNMQQQSFYNAKDGSIFTSSYTPFNKKMYTYPYKYLRLINNNSDTKIFKPQLFHNFNPKGDTSTYNFSLMYNDGVKFVMGVYPNYYNRNDDAYEEMLLTGEYPTIAWTEDSFTKWETQYGLQFGLGMISKGMANVEKGVSQGISTGSVGVGFARAGIELTKQVLNDVGTYYSRKNAYDDVNGSVGNIFLNYQNQKYITLYHIGITADNAKCIDNYFTVFGYAVKKYKIPYVCLYNCRYVFPTVGDLWEFGIRKRFNYIKCNDTNIDTAEGAYVNANDIDKIENIFNNGITFWNVEKDGNNYYTLNYNNYSVENGIVSY